MPSKITRLSSTDVANNAALPTSLKRSHLEGIEVPPVFWNLDPVRRNLPSIMRADPSLPLELFAGCDEALVAKVLSECGKWEEQRNTCEAITRALVQFRNERGVTAATPEVSVTPFRLTSDTIYFAENIVLRIDGVSYLVSLDLRSNSALTRLGREVVNSAIASRSRVGEFREMRIAILRTPNVGAGLRQAIFEIQPSEPRFGSDELDRMFSETYSIWELMLMARRSSASDGLSFSDGLFGKK
jgi:hypothetical protein